MQQFWDERYRQEAYVYGEAPNVFLKEQLEGLTPGKILFPAEGEGRNAVYAATLGWDTYGFDTSNEGKKKALALAQKHSVNIDYWVGTFPDLPYQPAQFDALALIYAHFPSAFRRQLYPALISYLRPGGLVIMEVFSKRQIEFQAKNPRSGGPRELDLLSSTEEVRTEFQGFETLLLEETETNLEEGLYHVGTGSVVRFVGRKKD